MAQVRKTGKSSASKKRKDTVGNVSSALGGKNSMGRRNGNPAATPDGYDRLMSNARKGVAKYRGAEGPKKSVPRKRAK